MRRIPQLFFNEMSNCVQGSSESELDFCLRAMSLRQKDPRLWLLLQFRQCSVPFKDWGGGAVWAGSVG